MSGISGGHPRDFTPAQERYYRDLVAQVRAEERAAKAASEKPHGPGRTPTVDYFRARAAGQLAPKHAEPER